MMDSNTSSTSSSERTREEPPPPRRTSMLRERMIDTHREPAQGEDGAGSIVYSLSSGQKRKASQPAEDSEDSKTPTTKRQKETKYGEEPAEAKKIKKAKRVRIAEPDVANEPAEADAGEISAANRNNVARYGMINEERPSTLDLNTDENVPFTDTDVAQAAQGHDRQAVEPFFHPLTGTPEEMTRIATMRLAYLQPFTVTNEMWAAWPELSLTMRLNLIEGLEEIENSKGIKKLHRRAAKLRLELERAQILLREPRSWDGDDEQRKNVVSGSSTKTKSTKSKGKGKPEDLGEDLDRNTWSQEDEDGLQAILLDTDGDDEDAMEKFKQALGGATPNWRPIELKFCEEYTKARKNLLPGTSWKDQHADGIRALSRAHRLRFEHTKFLAKEGVVKEGLYRSPFAVHKKLTKLKEPLFKKLWGVAGKDKASKSGAAKTGKVTARRRAQPNDDNEEGQQKDVDVSMEDVETRYDSDGDTISSVDPDADADEPQDPAADTDGKSDAGGNEDSSSDSSGSDDEGQKRLAKGKKRAADSAEKLRQQRLRAEQKRLADEAAEALKRQEEEEEEEHQKQVEEFRRREERKKSLKNGGKDLVRRKSAQVDKKVDGVEKDSKGQDAMDVDGEGELEDEDEFVPQ